MQVLVVRVGQACDDVLVLGGDLVVPPAPLLAFAVLLGQKSLHLILEPLLLVRQAVDLLAVLAHLDVRGLETLHLLFLVGDGVFDLLPGILQLLVRLGGQMC